MKVENVTALRRYRAANNLRISGAPSLPSRRLPRVFVFLGARDRRPATITPLITVRN